MTTSHIPDPLPTRSAPDRSALRLRMTERSGRAALDGGWWPQSRDLTLELPDLVDHFPPEEGRVVRATFSPPDWDPAPPRIRVASGFVEVDSFPNDDTHTIELRMSGHTTLRLLVVPPTMTGDQAEEALLAAATAGYSHTAASLLAIVEEHVDVDPRDHWHDGVGT